MRYRFRFGFALALSLALMAGCSDENGEGGSGGTAGTGGMAGVGGMAGTGGAAGEGGTGGTGECLGLYVDGSCAVYFCEGFPGVPPAEDGTLCLYGGPYDVREVGVCIDGVCLERECDVDADCTDHKDCTTDSCLSTGICEFVAVQDGTPCAGGTCEAGECALQGNVLPCTEQGIRNAIAAGSGPYTFDCAGPKTILTKAEIVIDNDVILDGEGSLTVDGNEDHRLLFVPQGVTAELHGFGVTRGTSLRVDSSEPEELQGGGIYNNGTLTLANTAVSANANVDVSASRGCGGIYNNGTLTLINVRVSDNTAGHGGGICITDDATATLTNSTVSGNIGGGIASSGMLTLINSRVSDNTASTGGGISNRGMLTLTNSTVSGNTATYDGGGIRIENDGMAMLINSTVSGNTATTGAGISLTFRLQTLTLTNSTVSGNEALEDGGAIAALDLGTLRLANTLIDGDCDALNIVSLGYNIESPGDTCGFDPDGTDQVNVSLDDLKLGELADNGGPTMTHALVPGSVAIDQIPAEDCVDADGQPLTTDQRGQPRPETGGTMCDVGAYEVQP